METESSKIPNYQSPPTSLLTEPPSPEMVNEEEQREVIDRVTSVLKSIGIEVASVEVHAGPTIMRLECEVKSASHISKAKKLKDDIAMCLACLGCRIIAPIPGKVAIGLEIPRKNPQVVSMRSVVESNAFNKAKESMELPFAVGGEIGGEILFSDLARTPHLLVAGATGMGKSVFLDSLITSLLFAKRPEDLKFLLIDLKMVEFSLLEKLKNTYLVRFQQKDKAIITTPYEAFEALDALCMEMENRYNLLRSAEARNISEYNEKFDQGMLSAEDAHHHLPYIVTIIDEFTDLMMVSRKKIELPICRLAQKARAVGIHLILATQRPSTNVISDMIKANFPGRIAFRVIQRSDSKTILDSYGAEQLIGRGDMLFLNMGELLRLQSPYIENSEIERTVKHIAKNQVLSPWLLPPLNIPESFADGVKKAALYDDSVVNLFQKSLRFTSTQESISFSALQRKFKIGFNKANLFLEEMEKMGIISQPDDAKPRKVLMSPEEVEVVWNTFKDELALSE